MILEVLPTRTAGAAENMAVDFLLLQRYPSDRAAAPRFRHYEWRRPAFTFGYSQKLAFVQRQLAGLLDGDVPPELCRRPTGGGIVDHRADWTYALVIPRGHPLEELRATQSYRAVHDALAAALRAKNIPAKLKPCAPESEPGDAAPGVCFQRTEIFDVVHEGTGAKIAGAAQKRNKHGLLFQGSISRPAAEAAGPLDWDEFADEFANHLAAALGGCAEPRPWPELDDDEVSGLTEQYASVEWLGYR